MSTEDFFDSQYLVRNVASLFGIPSDRMHVPKIVAGSLGIDIEIEVLDLCADVICGTHGHCYEGKCVCDSGYATPESCSGGDCTCSEQLGCPEDCVTCFVGNGTCTSCGGALPLLSPVSGRCVADCPASHAPDPSGVCNPCHSTCGGKCSGPSDSQCLACDSVGTHAYLRNGQCVLACGDGFYADESRVCRPCHSTCRQCTGPRSTDCSALHVRSLTPVPKLEKPALPCSWPYLS